MPLRPLPKIQSSDWKAIGESVLTQGFGHCPGLLDPEQCRQLIGLYKERSTFRKRITMARHNFGQGEYSYFSYPLPPTVSTLRTELYRRLVPTANHMMTALNHSFVYPPTLEAFLARCRETGQTQPTPLILRYQEGDYNRLHRDLYGETAFPLQAMILLNQPGQDFKGGEFILVDTRPRQQARARVLHPNQGDLIVFPVSTHPVPGKRGPVRASMRHGVSPLVSGIRWVLGIIFHDAQ